MSIKTKLSLIMSFFALVLLSLNITLSYFSTRDNLRNESEANMLTTARQIALAVEQGRSVNEYIQRQPSGNISDALAAGMMSMTSPEYIARETLKSNPNLLEITGIDPNNQILFGTFNYAHVPLDSSIIQDALKTGKSLLRDSKINGKRVLESIVPITPDKKAPYVIRIISSYDSISSVISKQMFSQITISLVLLQIVIFVSYILAGELIRPIQHILNKVDQLSSGEFETRLQVNRRDELGLLAHQINAMADSLGHYMNELEQKNEETRSMKEYLESIICQTADAIHVTDLEGRIIRVNPAFERLYGWSSDEAVGQKLNMIPAFLQEESKGWEEQLRQGKSVMLSETVRLKKDGSLVDVNISESPIYDEHGRISAYICSSRDMTEHHQMEELLRRSEKLTTVGQLAAGVAHEIRNPLTTLRGFLQMQQHTKSVNPLHTDIMLSELDRINLIVSEFLILAKPQAVQFQTHDVRFILGDVVSFLDSEAHLHNIEFQVHFSTAPVLVHCEENQLKQVFINILKNAMEAMPQGGQIQLELYSEGEMAIIRVTDEGEGISKERMQKLGEPFYTNKEKGTGLGLMITQRIIEGHKGQLHIESEVGIGTIVTIKLSQLQESDEL